MVFQFERDAEQGVPMPNGLSLPDQLAYQFLANLYDRIRRGTLTREQATSDKGKMTYQYNLAKGEMEQWSKLGTRWSQALLAAEQAQIKYQTERTLENADSLSAILDGRLQ